MGDKFAALVREAAAGRIRYVTETETYLRDGEPCDRYEFFQLGGLVKGGTLVIQDDGRVLPAEQKETTR